MALDSQTRTYIMYGLLAFNIVFLIFIFSVRYLTRNGIHKNNEPIKDEEE